MKKFTLALTASALVLSATLLVPRGMALALQPADHSKHAQPTAAPAPAKAPSDKPAADKAPERMGDPYPLSTCPVSGGKLGSMGDAIVKVYDGREVRFCCESCPPKFEKDLAASIAKLDETMIKDQLPLYPIDNSVVSGKKLQAGEKDKPLDFIYGNRLIRVVDKAEQAEFMKDPKKHLAALDKAVIAKQGKDYPLTKCVVSGDKLGKSDMGETQDVVVAGRLIRLCCDMCMKDLKKDPAKLIAMVDEARKASKEKSPK